VTTFYLIRHAQRSGDQHLLTGRLPGFSLTDEGRDQAERLARHLASESITRVFSSPMERAQETAGPIARQLRLAVQVLPAINEIDAGRWSGHTFGELDAGDEQWRRFNRWRSLTRIPGGESATEVQARFTSEMLRLQELYPADGIVLVSHADPIKIALAWALGAPLDFYDRLEIGLGSVSVVTLNEAAPKVLRLNESPPHGTARK
jgi:broad specificity phosphatase PhoE